MKAVMKTKKAKAKAEKKAKKAAKKGEKTEETEKKRKRDTAESSSPSPLSTPPPQKKPHVSSSSAAVAVMGKVAQELAENEKNAPASEALKSIFAKKEVKGNYLTMGTFNRYAQCNKTFICI